MFQKAIFIDKDGTLLENVPYNVDPSRICLCRGAARSVKRLVDNGYLPVLISNQSGVALGYFEEDDLVPVVRKIQELLLAEGTNIVNFYFCPHHPQGIVPEYTIMCACRKPAPGMLFEAARDLRIDLRKSWMIGDILHDVEAGNRAGCRTILIDNGNETEWHETETRTPDYVVNDMREAADVILQHPCR